MNWSELFVVGSLGFWLLLLVEAIVLIGLIEWGKGFAATLSLVGTLVLLQFLGNSDVLGLVGHHPGLLVFGLVGYFVLGMLWSVARWWLYVRDMRHRYDEARADFCDEHCLEGRIPESMQEQWQAHLQSLSTKRRKIEIRPRARQHRAKIVMWMAYWPGSLAWTMLNDPVRKTFQMIYRHIHDYLQEISDNAFKGVEEDFPRKDRHVPVALNGDTFAATNRLIAVEEHDGKV